MATIDLGKIRFNWQGAYNNSTAYVINDVVSSGGNSYICKLASTGNAVSNGTYWDLMSQAGTNGTDVGTVITTQGDILYRDGSGLQRLGAGTSGQFLKTQGTGANPVWAEAGGAWAVKSSGSFNDVVNVDFTINSAKAQRIYINGLNTFTQGTTTASSALMGIRTAPTSANTFATGSSDYYAAYWEIINGTTNRGGNSGNENRIVISANNMFGGNSLFNGEVEISIPKPQPETGQRPLVSVRLHSCGNPGNDHWWAYTSGSRQNSENIYSLRFYSHSANIGLKGSYVHTELN